MTDTTPAYIPRFTKQTNTVIHDIEEGEVRKIDVVNTASPFDRRQVNAWKERDTEIKDSKVYLLVFEDGDLGPYKFGDLNWVKGLSENAAIVT